jgi:hypothetical protein
VNESRRWCAPLRLLGTQAVGSSLLAMLIATAPLSGAEAERSPTEIDALIDQLGDPDYAVREAASLRLAALGVEAADAVLTAAETSADLEVALRARWLAESLPLATNGDGPEARALLQRFSTSGYDDRVRIMHRLLRLDDDAGIEPLARIVRLERTAAGSRIAAALLAREWQPNDPYWPALSRRILAGLGSSRRPAACFLRSLVAYSTAAAPAPAQAALDDAVAAAATLANGPGRPDEPIGLPAGQALGITRTGRIFRRCLCQMLARNGRRGEALAEAERILASARDEADPDAQAASELVWFAAHGLPEAVELVAERLAAPDVPPLLAYAAAVAWRARQEPGAAGRAEALATTADHRMQEENDFADQLEAAMLLAKWGAVDWAAREYRSIIEDESQGLAQRALAAILCSEFFHDQQRDAEAAAVLAGILAEDDDEVEQALVRLDRDPRAVRSRMLFFEASAAEEPAARRRLLEESVGVYPKDVDTLIALYQFAGNTAAQQEEAAALVGRAATSIAAEIAALPDDANGKNEYAWLIANTEGDLARALVCSRESLEDSFDNASYLDTLAHCHAAAGALERALRTQWLAVRQEPSSLLVRRNYERFLARAAAARPSPPATP